ncbi:AAA family ATPase [Pseudoalteromonas luteoviolacea]|uniref:Uridine kinase n=1 Tax=Pseudoalteromonas luteoviolacea H33 TaxID=1365251 RepID=A0A161XYL7_9GAMM|nr:AAA family ATPase [Pseudoalteromonas luteoviolacea]KZN48429.1 hypothetical protein N476_21395 [Pseudoalteromonas luteoviolacea H33]KZN73290.1 hypothetical protein N477_23495 [Pseudoalteromonas luteoviolacea H33-S]
MLKTQVIAISGASGCGKTSLIKAVSDKLNCPYLLFDEYTNAHTYPKDMKMWLKAGVDLNEIKTPAFIKALEELTLSCSAPYIFVEEPFGRCRAEISKYIDYVILLDVPLEVCLSRVITRNINTPHIDSRNAISKYLCAYDNYLSAIYANVVEQVCHTCDLTVTGVLPLSKTVDLVERWLVRQRISQS